MALSRLDALYMAVVTEHAKAPHHHGKLKGVTPVCLHNPSCGDVIELFLLVDDQQVVQDISFVNSGCTISTASASMMCDVVVGKGKKEALELVGQFSAMLQGKKEQVTQELGDATYLAGVAKFPQRIKCAMLAWNALKKALQDES